MTQPDRDRTIRDLLTRIRAGESPAVDLYLRDGRFLLPMTTRSRVPLPTSDIPGGGGTTRCGVCTIPLVGSQESFCWGHWDYLVAEPLDPSMRYREKLGVLADWLEHHALGLHVVSSPLAWARGRIKCEVCGGAASISESLVNEAGSRLKRHDVCDDHVSFRCPPALPEPPTDGDDPARPTAH